MSSGGRKIVVHESEKSQKVQMLNWIQDALFVNSKKTLSRSERTVVGRITVDQKLLYKRYQNKIHHSKIMFARITGNQDLERELINTVNLNTDVGREGESDVMLQRIWSAGSQKMENIRRLRSTRYNREYTSQFKLRIRSLKEDDSREEELEETCISRPMTAMSRRSGRKRTLRPHTSVCRISKSTPNLSPETSKKLSPEATKCTHFVDEVSKSDKRENEPIDDVTTGVNLTVIGTSQNDNNACADGVKVNSDENGINEIPSDQKTDSNKKHTVKLEPITATHIKASQIVTKEVSSPPNIIKPEGSQENVSSASKKDKVTKELSLDKDVTNNDALNDESNESGDDEVSTNVARPHTVIGKTTTSYYQPVQQLARSAQATERSNKQPHSTLGGLFDTERKPSLLEIHKLRLKYTNYEDKIDKFTETIKDFKTEKNYSTDYYNVRLVEQTRKEEERKQSQLKEIYKDLVTTTDGERRRWKGNLNVRSMTTRNLDLDFKNRPSTYIDVASY